MVVSVREKVSCKISGMNQGDEAIEPLLKCRKHIDEIKTGGSSLTRDKLNGNLFYWLSGLRHRGGMNLIWAFIWNVGN